jgi:16S rRNA processing protein RimM
MSAAAPAAVIVMGIVRGAYGVRGMVRVAPASQDPLALTAHPTWWLRAPGQGDWTAHAVSQARAQGANLVAALDGVDDRDAAEALRGAEIGVPRDVLPALGPDEWYWADLVGLEVVNREGVALGRVTGVIDNPAHPILRVQADGVPGERLIPWVPAYVIDIDAAARRIDVDWPADF